MYPEIVSLKNSHKCFANGKKNIIASKSTLKFSFIGSNDDFFLLLQHTLAQS